MNEEVPFRGEPLLAALEEAGVSFIVIGAFAVAAHGSLPTTKELAIIPDSNPENLGRLANVLAELNAQVHAGEEFSEDDVVQPDARGLGMGGNFVLITKHGRLDILQLVSPDLEYGDLDGAAIEDEVFGHKVRFCSYEHLIEMKKAAARGQDVEDLKRLREARGEAPETAE